jgi:excinuclease ABC subunit C
VSRRRPADDELAARRLEALHALVKAEAPDRPGVYQMLAEDGEVLYVGKSKRLRTRLMSYFRCVYPEDKGARLLRQAHTIRWQPAPSEFAALLEELRLIKQWRPRFNVAMKRDGLHYAFIKVTRGPAPKLAVVRVAGVDDSGVYYGPYHGAQRVGEAVRELNDVLGLRDCALDRRMSFTDQQEMFVLGARTPGCIRFEIGKCLGPCIGACAESEYDARLADARAFLDGRSNGPLDALRDDMTDASSRLEFERAAAMRDKLARLEALREQFGRMRYAVEALSFVYRVRGVGEGDRVYLIRRGRVRAEAAAPRTRRERRALDELVEQVFAAAERVGAAVPAHEIDELLLLTSWFKRFPREVRHTRAADAFLDRGWRAPPLDAPAVEPLATVA